MNLTDLAYKHWSWVESQGWHNKSPMEMIALIHTEVSELCQSIRLGGDNVDEEIADVMLRTMDLAEELGVEVQVAIENKMKKNAEYGNKGRER